MSRKTRSRHFLSRIPDACPSRHGSKQFRSLNPPFAAQALLQRISCDGAVGKLESSIVSALLYTGVPFLGRRVIFCVCATENTAVWF